MAAIRLSFFGALGSALRTRGDLVLENLALRQQLAVCKRRDLRPHLTRPDCLFWIALSRVWSLWRETMVLVQPETVVGWHRWAFRRFWTWRSREVSRLMPPRPRRPPSQAWCTFLANHVGRLASVDFFTVPTATFRVLYVFFVLAHENASVAGQGRAGAESRAGTRNGQDR